MPSDTFQWQDRGTAWKGIGIYHVTLTIPSREPLLGKLVIPDNDPSKAFVERSDLGKGVVHALAQIPVLHPQIRLLQYCLMPDHLHAVLHVTAPMPQSIRIVLRGFWQGIKKLVSPSSAVSSLDRDTIPSKLVSSLDRDTIPSKLVSSLAPNTIRTEKQNFLFTEQPFIRPLVHQGQLHSMIHYVQLNPQRLATKKLHPGFFYVQENVEIASRMYSAVGNIALLQAEKYSPVHVRRTMVDYAVHGEPQPLRDYKNSCVLAAREGTVMVSPFISEHEKAVLNVLLEEKRPIIFLADNGFGQYFKPSDTLFDAVAEGRLLILSPWTYDPKKKIVTRAECVALNAMAEEISSHQ